MDLLNSELGVIIGQLGIGAIFFVIYWYERKRNEKKSDELLTAYKENTEAFVLLKTVIEGVKNSSDKTLENNTKAVEKLVDEIDSLLKERNGK